MLVVCPKGLADQWKEELDTKFGIDAVIGFGPTFSELRGQPFWITSYATARNKMALIKARKFDLAILDEAHALKNLYPDNPPQVAEHRGRDHFAVDGMAISRRSHR